LSEAKNPGSAARNGRQFFKKSSEMALPGWSFHENVSRETFFSSGEQTANKALCERSAIFKTGTGFADTNLSEILSLRSRCSLR